MPLRFAIVLIAMLLNSCATVGPIRQPRPADVTVNREAGRGGFLFVTLRLEDGEELPFIVDTGSPATLVSKSLEPKLGQCLGTSTFSKYGNQTSGRYAAPRLYLGNTLLPTAAHVSTFDFTRLSSLSDHPIMGVLGLDCLRHYCIQLDFEAGTLRFLDSTTVNTGQLGKKFPLTFSSPDPKDSNPWAVYPIIEHCNLAGTKSNRLIIDTGCNIDGLVKKDPVKEQPTRLPEIIWDGDRYTNIHLGVEQVDVLGLRFLARHLVTLDFPHRTMYLKQIRTAPLNVAETKAWPNQTTH